QRARIPHVLVARLAPGPDVQPLPTGELNHEHRERIDRDPADGMARMFHVAPFVRHAVPARLIAVPTPGAAAHQVYPNRRQASTMVKPSSMTKRLTSCDLRMWSAS